MTFKDGATILGAGTLSSGTASLSTGFSTTGSYKLTAVYGGSCTQDAQNVVLIGDPGSGKPHLATALGISGLA